MTSWMQHGRLAALAVLTAVGMASAHADIRPVLGASLTNGGDTLARGSYSDGTSWKVSAGGFVHLFGGLEYQDPGSNIAIQSTLGYQVDDTSASNGSVSFSRWPVELLLLWQPEESKLRLGAGPRMALNPKLSSSGAGEIGDYKFKADTAMVLQGEWVSNNRLSFLVRFVKETYTHGGTSIRGDHFGIGLSVRL